MYLNYLAGGSACKRGWVNVHCSSFVDLGGERLGVIDRVALGFKITSCLEGHSAIRQSSSSVLQMRTGLMLRNQCRRSCVEKLI